MQFMRLCGTIVVDDMRKCTEHSFKICDSFVAQSALGQIHSLLMCYRRLFLCNVVK